jgi:hypothetical protein
VALWRLGLALEQKRLYPEAAREIDRQINAPPGEEPIASLLTDAGRRPPEP